MAETCAWDAIPTSGSGGEMSDFLKLQSGKTYKIRPIFEPVKFFKYFHKKDGKLKTAICGSKPDACPVKQKYGDELKKPALRFAAYVIDREDGKVKILEAPQSVFRPIGESLEITGKDPGSGKDGSDWYIKVSGQGFNTTYSVGFIAHTPLTATERASIKEALDGDKDKLKKLYKIDTPAEIEKKLFGDDSSDSNESSGHHSSPAPVEAPSAEAGDDFNQEW